MLPVWLLSSGCGLFFGNNEIDTKNHDYDIYRLDRDESPKWKMISNAEESGGDKAFENTSNGAVISLNSVCNEPRDLSHHQLLNSLLLGLELESEPVTQTIVVDGEQCLEGVVSTKSRSGKKLKIKAVVLKKANCTFDFMFIASPSAYKKSEESFQRFLRGFHVR